MSAAQADATGFSAVRRDMVLVNLGSMLAQIVQLAGYPTLLALSLARQGHAAWLIGGVLSLQWAVVFLAAPTVPRLMGVFGARAVAQAGAMASMAALGVLLLSDGLASVVPSTLLMGFGLTMRWVACDTWIVHATPPAMRGRVIGVHETLMGVGIAVGPLLTMLGVGNEASALVLYLAIMVGSFTCFRAARQAPAAIGEGEEQGGHFRSVLLMLFLALLAALASGYVETSMVALLPLYLISFDYAEAQSLVLLSLFGLGGTVMQAPIGWAADRWGFRAAQLGCLTVLIAGGALLPLTLASPGLTAAVLFFWGGCAAGLNTLAVIEAGASLRAAASGMGMALVASGYTLGGAIGPAVTGSALHAARGHGAMLVMVGLLAAYTGTLFFLPRAPAR